MSVKSDTYTTMQLLATFRKENEHRTQVLYLTLAGLFGTMAYPFTRTSAAPYFNAAYGSEYLSLAMFAAAALAIVVCVIYNQLAKRFELIPLCIYAMTGVAVITLFFGFFMGHHPRWMALLYYAWSDVYILILVEQFWSISNTLFTKDEAKKYYGIFLLGGAFGSMIGAGLVAKLVGALGSDNMIFLCSASLGLFIFFIALLHYTINEDPKLKSRFKIEHELAESSTIGGASLVFRSRYLTLIALLVVATQIYINGAYFLYNRAVDASVQSVDMQSSLYGQIFFIIQILTISINLVITPLALKFLGVGKTHYSVVGVTIIIFALAAISPHLALIAALFVAAKGFDYSIFRAAKEMFYLPLHVAEKFQAKAFIDVFLYRFSKAIAALGILLVNKVWGISIYWLIGFGLALWLLIIILILPKYRKQT